MKKLVMRIRGGLGNQLFILGHGLALADNSKEEVQLVCDRREYEYYKIRDYELEALNVSDILQVYEGSTSKDRKKYDLLMRIFHLRLYLISHLKLTEKKGTRLEKILGFIYKLEMVDIEEFSMDEIYMYGYFVDAKSLLKIRHKLQYLFDLKDSSKIGKYIEAIEKAEHTIAISMRLGQDYVEAKWPICDVNYYLKALEHIKRENTKLFVFSDDIEKAKDILKDFDCVYILNCSPAEQLALMSKCDDYVISNSTFSWWGAFLGHNENRIVCSPQYWHTGKTTSSKLFYSNMYIVQ
ncbi:MAG: alpha-1,2-fucosyltransferase [Roseburia sp.]|nr:alpha-1,2-fucosyltransferase [Roseburia sp.]